MDTIGESGVSYCTLLTQYCNDQLYSTSRIGAVGAVISSLVGFSATSRINCQV